MTQARPRPRLHPFTTLPSALAWGAVLSLLINPAFALAEETEADEDTSEESGGAADQGTEPEAEQDSDVAADDASTATEPSAHSEPAKTEGVEEPEDEVTGDDGDGEVEAATATESGSQVPDSSDQDAGEPSMAEGSADGHAVKHSAEAAEEGDEPTAEAAKKPKFELHIYADVGLQLDDLGDSFEASFELGDLSLAAQAQLGPKMSGIVELVFEMTPDRAPVAKIGQLVGRYVIHDLATVRVGRFYSPIGFFLTHHDTRAPVFWLAPDTPRLLEVTSSKSMIHGTMEGGELSGSVTIGKLGDLSYNVAGGLAHGAKPVALGRIALAPAGPLTGLEVGASLSVHRGNSSAASGLLSFSAEEEEDDASDDGDDLFSMMVVGHAAYNSEPIEAVVEVYYVHNSENFAGEGHDLLGAWGQVGVTIKRLTPFARYEYWKRSEDDSFYNAGEAPIEWNELMAGVRLQLSDQVALKGSYSHRFHDNSNVGFVQVALGF